MKNSTLLSYYSHAYNHAIAWNFALFFVMNFSYTLISTSFFYKLTNDQFTLWANLCGLIYLTVLWCDGGMRQTIPTFIPHAFTSQGNRSQFIRWVIGLQTIIGLIGITCLYTIITTLTSDVFLVGLCLSIFVFEIILTTMQSFFHGQFLNKEYNQSLMSFILLEIVVFCGSIFFIPQSFLLHAYFVYKLIYLVASISYNGQRLFTQLHAYADIKDGNLSYTHFVQHTSTMWGTSVLKSLSERNALVPLITFFLGGHWANIYKVSNDWALFIYRTLIKTIGTSDISFISHVLHQSSSDAVQTSFTHLFKKCIRMTIPFIVVVAVILIYTLLFDHNKSLIMFVILTISYLLEITVTPYTRVLENRKQYIILVVSHIPFLLIPFALWAGIFSSIISLILAIVLMRCAIFTAIAAICTYTYNLSMPSIRGISLKKLLPM